MFFLGSGTVPESPLGIVKGDRKGVNLPNCRTGSPRPPFDDRGSLRAATRPCGSDAATRNSVVALAHIHYFIKFHTRHSHASIDRPLGQLIDQCLEFWM